MSTNMLRFTISPLISASSFTGYDLKYDELNQRLNYVKREFGLRRAVSTHSLTGETRTFAEILDVQVETIVLYYLEVQGILAKQLRGLREEQVQALQNCTISMIVIDDMCHKYRTIGLEILDLLNYLERNSLALQKILHRHDALFDQKMGSMYFDSRFSGSKNSQLRQLYHQEGVKALVASIRRGFEELYDARNALINTDQFPDGRDSPLLGRAFDGTIIGTSGKQTSGIKLIPKVPFRKRLASFSSLNHLFQQHEQQQQKPGNGQNKMNESIGGGGTTTTTGLNTANSSSESLGGHSDKMKRNAKSNNNLDQLISSGGYESGNLTRQRSLSELEPILFQISDVAQKLLKTQSKTTVEFLSSYGAMGLEISMNEIRRAVQGDGSSKAHSVRTSMSGLYLNLFVTFIYSANQYIVAPTSAQYAAMLGLGPSMSGLIIGLAPVASLVSALLYSQWTNTSFKQPLLFSVIFGVLGNLQYAAALQFHSTLLLFCGRLLTGFAGTRVISRRYIADHVALEDRLLASSQFVTAGAMGLACGPLSAALMERSNLKFDLHGYDGVTVIFAYDNVNAPGWIMTFFWLISLVAILIFFEEPKPEEKKPSPKTYGTLSSPTQDVVYAEPGLELLGGSSEGLDKSTDHLHIPFHKSLKKKHTDGDIPINESTPMLGLHSLKSSGLHQPTNRHHRHHAPREPSCFDFITTEVYILLFILTVNKTGQELAISSMPFLGKEVFNLGIQIPGYYMAVIGALVLPVNICVSQIMKEMEEREIVLRLSYVILFGISLICHFGAFGTYSLFQYFIGTAVIFTTLNAVEGVIMSLLSKLISPDLAKGTFNSGLLATEAGSLGRVLGDMCITVFGNDTSTSALLVNQLYLPLALLIVATILLLQQFYDKFVE